MVKSILLTGASGFIGMALCQQLLNEGYQVLALSRRTSNLSKLQQCFPAQMRIVYHDLTAAPLCDTTFNNIDCIIHLAAFASAKNGSAQALQALNVDATLALARQAQQAKVKRFIFLSSAQASTLQKKLGSEQNYSTVAASDSYAASKLAAEQALQTLCADNAGMQLVIIRPPLVYGPGVKGNFAMLYNAVAQRKWLPLGAFTSNQRSYIALTNLIDFIQLCLVHPQAAAQPWLISDNDNISTVELVRRLAQAQQKPLRLLAVPVWLLAIIAKLSGKSEALARLSTSMVLDISAAQQQLAWQPQIGMVQQLAIIRQFETHQ